MRKLTAALLLLCLACAPTGLCAQAAKGKSRQESKKKDGGQQADAPPSDDEVLTVETPLVTVPVRVSDRAGRFLTDLKQENFRLFEDGVEQKLSFFETADQPFTVALMLDMSDSARFKREEIQAAAKAFVDELRAQDRVLIASFDKNVNVMTGATGDRQLLYAAISRAKSGGGTSLYDAIDEVLRDHLNRIPGRKAVVILSDGVDTASRATDADALYAAEGSNALVYAVQYDTIDDAARAQLDPISNGQIVTDLITPKGERLSAAYKRASLYLRVLTDKTGGRFYRADNPKNLSASFARVAAELRQQYSLGYYPANRAGEGKPRKIRVEVNAPAAVVRARRGYIFKPRRVARRAQPDAVASLYR
jgi:Ca-activated chloride channel family protein